MIITKFSVGSTIFNADSIITITTIIRMIAFVSNALPADGSDSPYSGPTSRTWRLRCSSPSTTRTATGSWRPTRSRGCWLTSRARGRSLTVSTWTNNKANSKESIARVHIFVFKFNEFRPRFRGHVSVGNVVLQSKSRKRSSRPSQRARLRPAPRPLPRGTAPSSRCPLRSSQCEFRFLPFYD